MIATKLVSSPPMRRIHRSSPTEVEAALPPSISCLQQADVCCEQAREAARLKRFGAAFGLFTTATTLCRHALSLQENDEKTRTLAAERLMQINLEVATYAELFKGKK